MSPASSIRLVLDQGLPRNVAGELRALGYDCIHVGEVGMSTASDEQILQFALSRHVTVVTLDADSRILAVSGAAGPSVIRLRLQGLGVSATTALVKLVLSQLGTELEGGSLITVKPRKTTCHRLPIGNSD